MSNCKLYGEDCSEETHEECEGIFNKYAKVVFCNDHRCLWNKDIDVKKYVRARGTTPFPDDYYKGICTRPELGLKPAEVETLKVKRKLTTCSVRSDKTRGYTDFSKLPQGGSIPDPIDPSTAYINP